MAFNVGEEQQANTDLNGDGDATDNVLHIIDLTSGVISNLELAVLDYVVDRGHIALEVREADQGGVDLNGDGVVSPYDRVLHLYDFASNTTLNLQLSTSSDSLDFVDFAFVNEVLVVPAGERTHDLNGDGDTSDSVLQKVDMNGNITNTGVSARELVVSGDRVAFRVREGSQGSTDLNGDGDIADHAMGVYDVESEILTILPYDAADRGFQLSDSHLAFHVSETNQGFQDLNGDGDTRDRVLHVHDFAFDATTNFAVHVNHSGYYRLAGDQLAYNVAERSRGDLNGDGDSSDSVLHVATLRADPVVLIFEQLEQSIGDLNLSSGIENSLSVKLLGALKSYQQDTGGGDPAIANKLEALIQAIEAHRDKRIASADADQLIADIRTAIVLIQASVT